MGKPIKNIITGFRPQDAVEDKKVTAYDPPDGTSKTPLEKAVEMAEMKKAVDADKKAKNEEAKEKKLTIHQQKQLEEKQAAKEKNDAVLKGIATGAFQMVGDAVFALKDTPYFAINLEVAKFKPHVIEAHKVKTPPLPLELWLQMMDFMWKGYEKIDAENQITAWYNKTTGEWRAWPLKQEGIGMSTTTLECPENDKYVQDLTAEGFETQAWCFTMHHHCSASAFQSGVDKADEDNRPGIHVTVGNLKDKKPTLHVRCVARMNAVRHEGVVVKPSSLVQWTPAWTDVVDIANAIPQFMRGVVTPTMYADILANKPENVQCPEGWLECVTKKSYHAPVGHSYPNQTHGGYAGITTGYGVQRVTTPHTTAKRVEYLTKTGGADVSRPQVETFLHTVLYNAIDLELPQGTFPDAAKVHENAYMVLPTTSLLAPLSIEPFESKHSWAGKASTRASEYWHAVLNDDAIEKAEFGLKKKIDMPLKRLIVSLYIVALHMAEIDLKSQADFDNVAMGYDNSLGDWLMDTDWVGQAIAGSIMHFAMDPKKYEEAHQNITLRWFCDQLPELRRCVAKGSVRLIFQGLRDSIIPGWKRGEILSGGKLHESLCDFIKADTYIAAAFILKMGSVTLMAFGQETLLAESAMHGRGMHSIIPNTNEYTWGHHVLACAKMTPQAAVLNLESIDETMSAFDVKKINDLGTLLEFAAINNGHREGHNNDDEEVPVD